eukprot:TRINITY_DN9480_c0_g1_i1.p1 TRINITY_DN9480_c0_g1~~TRINITY_DN9480_c0_g1_i1.p1  ORF type:complete len:513 (+),score=147.22 TRINITY_DN9480_c0_g1_i1:231-1541(+)
MSFLLMGTSDAVPEEPAEKMVFVEDLTENELVSVSSLPPGLVNLGNTCYMNATLQCLRSAPALKQAIESYTPDAGSAGMPAAQLVNSFSSLSKALTAKRDNLSVQSSVMLFLNSLRTLNPRFAEQQQGHYAQQDAAECWGEIMRSLDQNLTTEGRSLIQRYFGIENKDVLKNTEAMDEKPVESTSRQLQLSCHIDKDVNYMMVGLERALQEEITKTSETLGRDALYIKSSTINRLPQYLVVNFVRFYYKKSVGENCKIRKEVKFPMTFDAHKLCSPELQEKLKPARDQFQAYRDWESEQQASSAGKKKAKTEENAVSAADVEVHPTQFESDPGSNNSGFYELKAVLTHKGRSSNSGHYVAWTKQADGSWVLFDDDNVSVKKDEDILALSGSGGADWHTAYILLYASQPCKKIPSTTSQESSAPAGMDTATDAAASS